MQNKCLSLFFNSDSLNGLLTTHLFLINKLSEEFDKIYLINLKYIEQNLKSKKSTDEEFNYNIDPNFYLPRNVVLINLNTIHDFKKFMVDKELVVININNFSTNLPSIKLLLFLNRFNIKLIQINDIANIKIKQKIELNYLIKGIKFKIKRSFFFFLFFFSTI